MNYFLLAGEASGDLHGGNLAKALLQSDPNAKLFGWGGAKMEKAGVQLLKRYDELAIMGFVEVITKIPTILSNFKQGIKDVSEQEIDAVILIDFSGFNLRFAKRLRKSGFKGKIYYYISPKLWVWNSQRVNSFKKYIDEVYCILPFEVQWYKDHDYHHAVYIGNPLMDEIAAFNPNPEFIEIHHLTDKPLIALLPGSRPKEVKLILPELLQVVNDFPNYQFVIAGLNAVKNEIETALKEAKLSIPIVYNETYDLVVNANCALVTSGTATLEVALLNTPLVLCYKANWLSYIIAKTLVNIKYIGLPNLIMNKTMVKELLQSDLTKANLLTEINALLNNTKRQADFKKDQAELVKKVGGAGASDRAANHIINSLQSIN